MGSSSTKNRYFAGIDVGGSSIKWVLSDSSGIWRRGTTPLSSSHPEDVVKEVKLLMKMIQDDSGVRLSRVGVGVPGFIVQPQGVVHVSPNFPLWKDVPFLDRLKENVDVPVFLENDANCALLGEYWLGAARGAKNQCLLTLGTGIGGAIMVGGKVLRGLHGYAAEVGHMIIREGGVRCGCGGRGCLEMYASGTAIMREVRSLIESGRGTGITEDPSVKVDGLSVKSVISAAEKGDREALDIVGKMGRSLGVGVSTLINIFNPERIILTGGIAEAFELIIPFVLESIEGYAISPSKNDVEVLRGELSPFSGSAGAAYLAIMGGAEADLFI